MCGLVAALRCESTAFAKAVELIEHRGVRTRVIEAPGGASMAHARLPIVGLGEEHDQPMVRGRWTVAFVGQLLDFRDADPAAECDAELAADLWAEGHTGFINRDGFWLIAAINDMRVELHVLTDYLAQKPGYYRSDCHAIAVASEPDAVAAMGPTTPDEVYLSAVVKWGYCPETWRTPYREIRKTLPGEWVVLTRVPGIVRRKIVDPLQPQALSLDLLKREIEAAVKRRVLSSDVPVAALVSGGLDSAITYTLAKRWGDVVPLHVENGEHREALEIAPDLVLLRDPRTTPEKALSYMQEPIDLGSLMPQAILSDAIGAIDLPKYSVDFTGDYDPSYYSTPTPLRTQKIHVCLTGDGADELFGGYSRSARYDSQASDVWHELVAWHLPRLDRVMMRNQVEVRSPFLARRVAAAALALPWAERRGDKQVLRRLFRDDLPRGASERPKRPLRLWEVANDRESWSRRLVEMFRDKAWGK